MSNFREHRDQTLTKLRLLGREKASDGALALVDQEHPQPTGRADTSPEATAAETVPTGRKPWRKRALLGAVAVAALVAAGFYGEHWMTVGRYVVSTDDAYVSAYNTTLASKVAGYVSSIDAKDNAYVHAGDVIARIDDGDYRLAVQAAKDKIAAQEATIARLDDEMAPQRAAVTQAEAQVKAAEAGRTRSGLEFDRQQALAKRDFASGQKVETARADRDQSAADVQRAKAAVVAAKGNVGVLEGKRQEAERSLEMLKTDLAKAERDLSFTVVRAPVDGVVGNRAAQVGDYVTPGARLVSIVPLDQVFIDANFKETQIAKLQPGQKVSINVDALPDHPFEGTVESLAPASGSVFSLLPPDNATGNFTKIVQRLPVRISVAPEVLSRHVLRPGMSVVVDVNTKAKAVASLDRQTAGLTR